MNKPKPLPKPMHYYNENDLADCMFCHREKEWRNAVLFLRLRMRDLLISLNGVNKRIAQDADETITFAFSEEEEVRL